MQADQIWIAPQVLLWECLSTVAALSAILPFACVMMSSHDALWLHLAVQGISSRTSPP